MAYIFAIGKIKDYRREESLRTASQEIIETRDDLPRRRELLDDMVRTLEEESHS